MTDTTPAVRIVPEWLREGSLIYSLMQDGWRKGQPVMVNDVMIRVEVANRSTTDIEPIIQTIMSALAAAPVAPADSGLSANPVDASSRTDPVGNVDPDGDGDDILIQRARELASLDGDFGALTTPYAKLTLTAMANRLAALRARSEPGGGGMSKPFYAVAASCDFYPEGAKGLIEPSFLTLQDKENTFGAGLYRIEFVRPLTAWEHENYEKALRQEKSRP